MRTTVDLPDPIFRKLKALAARRGTSLKKVLLGAVEAEIRKPAAASKRRLKFPLLRSQEPGSLNLSNAEIDDLSA